VSEASARVHPVAVLGTVGLAAGFLSALFGVGGGIVVVPLLILLAGFGPKRATGTSLAAISVTALFGVASFAALDEVSWSRAAVVGIPAIAGALVGTRLQRAVSSRFLTLLFAIFLVVVAVVLVLE
jgi:uncharacterized membrane protein YfcA